jgi:hypothetical protein
MPIIIFEKLSNRPSRDATPVHAAKPRGALTRFLDRFAEYRLQQTERTISRARTKSGARAASGMK